MMPGLSGFFPDPEREPRDLFLKFPELPKVVSVEEVGDVLIVIRGNDRLGVGADSESVNSTIAALQFSKKLGACAAEVDQACDVLKRIMLEREGR